jgi:hypothetical protein
MTKSTCFKVLAAASIVAAGFVTPFAGTPAEKSVMVTVLDDNNVALKNLTPADISVYEDSVKRVTTTVELAAEPLFVSVLIDNAKSPMGEVEPIRDMRTSLKTFVNTVLTASPTAQISLTTVGGAGVPLANFTSSAADLEKTLNRFVPDHRSGAVVLEALIDVSKALAKKPSPRRAIVTIDMASKEASSIQPSRVAEEVRKSGASVWSVSVHGTQGQTAPARDTTLNYLVENTGGVRATALLPAALEGMLTRVAEALTTQYVVTYTRPDGPPSRSVAVTGRKGSKFLLAPWLQ